MNVFGEFHFLRPLALLLLLALPLVWWWRRAGRGDAGSWRGIVDAHLLPHLIEPVDAGARNSSWMIGALAWALASVALAGPAWERDAMPLYRNQAARVIAIELAPSMLAQDVKPSRLERARFKIDDILKRSRDYQTALIGYAGEAFVAAPLTDDVETVRNLVESLDPSTMPVVGNATAKAIDAASALIEQAGLHHGTILVIADGVSADAGAAARRAHAKGFEVSVLGVGSAAGAPVPLAQGDFLKDASGNMVVTRLDENALRAVSDRGGGHYAQQSADAGDLDALLPDRAETVANETHGVVGDAATTNATAARWRDRGPWLLWLIVPLALCGFRRGWLMVFALATIVPTRPTLAASLADWWQRPDQQAAAALAQGDAKRAAGVGASPAWQASAAYRNGDYGKAADDFAKSADANGAYNKGNALAKLGRYDDAIAAYDEALKRNPDMTDAKTNRAAVEAFRQQQKQQQQKSGDKGDKNGDKSQRQKPGEQNESGQPGDEKKDGDKDSQQQSDQNDNGEQQSGQQKPTGADQDGEKKPGDQKKSGDAQDSNSEQNPAPAGGAGDDKDKAAQQAQADQKQREALSKDIDKAMAGAQTNDADKSKPTGHAPVEDAASSEKRQALEHWLQRVPDDPGGLLRRKFQLEYQRRQQGGGESP